jgi:hypothetical protein
VNRWFSTVGWIVLLIGWSHPGRAAENCVAMKTPPDVPKITRDVFPGEGFYPGKRETIGKTTVYDSREGNRRPTASLDSGTTIDVANGLIVVEPPDEVRVTARIEKMHLEPGDTILRYAYFGEGQADLWAKGCWYGNSDAGFITEIDGTGCQGNLCAARVTKNGTKIWWLRIILPDGRTGWSALENFSFAG